MTFAVHAVYDPHAMVLELRAFPGIDEPSICLIRLHAEQGLSRFGVALDRAVLLLQAETGVLNVRPLTLATFEVQTMPGYVLTSTGVTPAEDLRKYGG